MGQHDAASDRHTRCRAGRPAFPSAVRSPAPVRGTVPLIGPTQSTGVFDRPGRRVDLLPTIFRPTPHDVLSEQLVCAPKPAHPPIELPRPGQVGEGRGSRPRGTPPGTHAPWAAPAGGA